MSTSLFSSSKIEDILLLATPFIVAVAGSNITNLIPGTTGFVLGVAIAALAKTAAGLVRGSNSYEDLLGFFITLFGLIGTSLTADPRFVIYGTVLGFAAKALPSFASGLNWEDLLLFIGAFFAGLGAFFNIVAFQDVGFLAAAIGKAVPSLASPPATPTVPSPVAVVTKTA